LEEYVLVNTKHQRVEIFQRHEQGGWIFKTYTPTEGTFPLQSLNLTVSLADLYEDVTLESHSTETPEA